MPESLILFLIKNDFFIYRQSKIVLIINSFLLLTK